MATGWSGEGPGIIPEYFQGIFDDNQNVENSKMKACSDTFKTRHIFIQTQLKYT